MFELRKRDAGGRIARWRIKKHEVTTPTIAIVVNPNKQGISPKEIKRKFKAEIIITNAYILKNSAMRGDIEDVGIHRFLGWRGPVYTDSGTFQMYSKGHAKIGPEETIEFQKKIGSDIITPLDEFTLPEDSRQKAKEKLNTTALRIKQARELIGQDALLNCPIQGGMFLDLRRDASLKANASNPDIFSIGGIVPLMEQYRFKELAEIIIESKKALSAARPVHAFGCGHPMLFSLLVALGIDVFDSAAYTLFAQKGRYMTSTGTFNFSDLEELPCSCPVCSSLSKREFSEEDIARHNLYITFYELREIREAIRQGNLWDLVLMRSRGHTKMYEALTAVQGHNKYLEKQEPLGKNHAFFYTGRESSGRPEIFRAKNRIRRVANAKGTYKWMGFDIPVGLRLTYPFGQSVVPGYYKPRKRTGPVALVSDILQYQYGKNAAQIITKKTRVEVSDKTKRPRRVWEEHTLLGTIRASDGVFLPTLEGAKRLHDALGGRRYCVVVDDSVRDFAVSGKNVFARFVRYAHSSIRPGDWVFVVDSKNSVLSCGVALMNKKEMHDFDVGVAVHVKHHTSK